MTGTDLPARRDRAFLTVNAVFVALMALLAAVAAWPIYQSGAFIVMVAGALGAAFVIVAIGLVRGWSWFALVLATLVAYLILGVPLAIPSALGSLPSAAAGWLDLVTATVFSWKELITIQIPVGQYQSLLVPAFILFLGGTTAALTLAARARRLYVLAVPVLFLLQLFGLVFGSTAVSSTVSIGGVALPAPRESAIGLAGFLLGFGFLAWRTRQARSQALSLASTSSGVRPGSGVVLRRARRGALAVGVLLLALVAAVPTAIAANPAEREVLRSAIDPGLELHQYVSPLSQYRSYFDADHYDSTLFEVTGSGAASAASRVRLAVLSYYDGQVFRVVDPATGTANQATAFARLPSTADPADSESLTITIDAYRGPWLPGATALTGVAFTGERSQALTDGFFYSATTEAGVELNGVTTGDSYTVSFDPAAEPEAATQTLTAPASPAGLTDPDLIPASLTTWVQAQQVGSDGAGLVELVTRLRERGYLSHGITAPSEAGTTNWTGGLGDYVFEPSLAGHSSDRIDALYSALLDKQNSTQSTDNSQLVAGVGDDEQFAVAAALLAQTLGFPSRVVLGFALADSSAGSGAIPACTDGVCRGGNLSAWIEVQGADGAWTTIETTPQHTDPLSPLNDSTRDPEIATEVVQQPATEQLPPAANPASGDDQAPADDAEGPDLRWLTNLLKVVGTVLLVLLVLATPFLAVLGAKISRRRERRRTVDLAGRFAGGWDEYVDAAVDRGFGGEGSQTRSETAAKFGSAGGARLATLADQAVFGPVPPAAEDGEAYWALVDLERAELLKDADLRHRLRAALSMRSFARHLGPARTRGTGMIDHGWRLLRRTDHRTEERPPTSRRAH